MAIQIENQEEKIQTPEEEKHEEEEKILENSKKELSDLEKNINENTPEQDVYKELQNIAKDYLSEKQLDRMNKKIESSPEDESMLRKQTEKMLSIIEKAINKMPEKTEKDKEKKQKIKDKIAELKEQLPMTKEELLKEKKDITTRDLFENPKHEKFFNQMFDSYDKLSPKQQEQRKQKITDYLNIGKKDLLSIK